MLFYRGRQNIVDENGDPVSGALATFYLTGTNTLAPIYTTAALDIQHSNPVQASDTGFLPPVYLDPAITYRAVITDADGGSIPDGVVDPIVQIGLTQSAFNVLQGASDPYKRTAAEIAAGVTPVSYGYAACDLRRYGGNPDGATDSTTAVVNASLASAGSSGNIIVDGGTYRIASNTTIAAGATLEFRQGGKLTIDSGKALSINSSIIAPNGTRLFLGTGTVRFGTSPAGTSRNSAVAIYPEWWGALADGTTDSTAAINSAISATSWGGVVQFTAGVYLTDGIVANGGVRLQGIGKEQTLIKSRIAGTLILLNNTVSMAEAGGFSVRDLSLDGNSVGTIGVRVNNYSRFNLQDCKIYGFSSRAAYFHGVILAQLIRCELKNSLVGFDADTDQSNINAVSLRDCSINGCTAHGVRVDSGSLFVMDGCDIEGCGTAGDANTDAIVFTNMDVDGLGVAAVVKDCWMELNNGYAGIRINAPATSYAQHIITGTHVFAGTRTYGISVLGTGNFTSVSIRECVFQNAGTTDMNIGTNVVGTVDHVRATSNAISSVNMTVLNNPANGNFQFEGLLRLVAGGGLAIPDGVTAPSTQTGYATIYVDTADGDLKVKFSDGTVKTIVVDT